MWDFYILYKVVKGRMGDSRVVLEEEREHICPDIPAQHRPITTTSTELPLHYSNLVRETEPNRTEPNQTKPNETKQSPAPANYHNIHRAATTLL